MENLIQKVEELKKSDIKKKIDERINEFKNIKNSDIFSELCFCILTANSSAERCIYVQKHAKNCFENLPQHKLAERLKKLGARFHTKRAGYIVEARENKKELCRLSNDGKKAREWLVENIKGLGMKESSHFLRNIGYDDVAIIDFHIIDILVENKIIDRPKNLNKNKYLKIEKILKKIAKNLNLTLAELDLYLWYLETGKILK